MRPYFNLSTNPDKRLLLTGTMVQPSRLKRAAGNAEPISIEAKGIEWTDHMSAMNAYANTLNMKWIIRDIAQGVTARLPLK